MSLLADTKPLPTKLEEQDLNTKLDPNTKLDLNTKADTKLDKLSSNLELTQAEDNTSCLEPLPQAQTTPTPQEEALKQEPTPLVDTFSLEMSILNSQPPMVITTTTPEATLAPIPNDAVYNALFSQYNIIIFRRNLNLFCITIFINAP